LKQLSDEGLATSHTEKQEGKPERYVYTLTEKGLAQLSSWLTEPVEQSVERNELLLKLFFGQHTSIEKNIEHVRAFQTLQTQLLEKYEGIGRWLKAQAANDSDCVYSLITVRYGIHRCRALLAWCDETVETLEALSTGQSS
jgi:DNA-binding PadR family transcriptional regulator